MTLWIHIGECPVCVDGLCRVRCCESEQGEGHLYAMCDECEAIFLEPSTSSERSFPSAESPDCPICARPLYGPQAHWATAQELEHTDWNAAAIFEVSSEDESNRGPSDDLATDASNTDFITSEDIAGDLDAPPPLTKKNSPLPEGRPTVEEPRSSENDIAHGHDEPKPGC